MEVIYSIKEALKASDSKISTAESCTAGYISKLLTSIAGSSEYFEGSLIVYSNKAKINVLGVDKELIDKHTEVSAEVACRMAERVKEVMGTDYSIATTGYSDINGYGTDASPAGTIYIAISTPTGTKVDKITLDGTRERNSYLTSICALEMLAESFKIHQV